MTITRSFIFTEDYQRLSFVTNYKPPSVCLFTTIGCTTLLLLNRSKLHYIRFKICEKNLEKNLLGRCKSVYSLNNVTLNHFTVLKCQKADSEGSPIFLNLGLLQPDVEPMITKSWIYCYVLLYQYYCLILN